MAKPIDYDALAKQYGGNTFDPASSSTKDYSALAKQFGGSSVDPNHVFNPIDVPEAKTTGSFLPGALAQTAATGIGKGYDFYKSLPPIRALSTVVGAGVGLAGGAIGGITGALGTPIANTLQDRPLFQGLGQNIVQGAKNNAQFGFDVGSEGAAAAPLGMAGRLPAAALGYAGAYQGANQLMNAPDTAGKVEGGINLGLGVLGMLAAGAPGNKGLLTKEPSTGAMQVKQAIRPPKNNRGFNADLNLVLQEATPELRQAQDMTSFRNALLSEKKNVWQQVEGNLSKGEAQNLTVDGSLAAQKIRGMLKDPAFRRENITKTTEKDGTVVENKSPLYLELEKKANAYDSPIPVQEAETILENKNAGLQSYYAANRTNQAATIKADPSKAADIFITDVFRAELDKKLSAISDKQFAQLKNKYGALKNVANEAEKRANAIENLAPNNLSEQISIGRTAGNFLRNVGNFDFGDALASLADYGATKYLKFRNSPNQLLQQGLRGGAPLTPRGLITSPTRLLPILNAPKKTSQ